MNKLNRRKLKILSFVIITVGLVLSSIFMFSNESSTLFESHVNSEVKLKTLSNSSKNKDFKNSYGVLSVNNSNYKKDIEVYPGGTPVGVKISTTGVLAVGYSDIENSESFSESPAKNSGIEVGDVLLELDSKKINNSKDLSKKINECNKNQVEILINRNGNEFKKIVNLVKGEENRYKIGLWVRDSTAGVGTLTFYEKNTGRYGALGHPITDSQTEKILSVKNGDLVKSSIVGVRRGERGIPGELKGIFLNQETSLGSIVTNTQCGIFGKLNINNFKTEENKSYKIGYKDDVKLGKAHIVSTIDENGPQMYEIEVVKLLSQDEPGPKSMVIKITDPVLLDKTGGIVQGMSGSPIIQNNKIIGAVTHVLVNRPDTGYGIYIEWMLKDAKIIK